MENGNKHALEYLHDMSVEAVPIAEILAPEVLNAFDSLDAAVQRRLLLEGYPTTMQQFEKQWRGGNISDVEYRFGWPVHMVQEAYQLLTREGDLLPPLDKTLSQVALKKLDDLNPLLQTPFRLVWENTRMHSTIDPKGKLERNLLNMPLEMPGIKSLGLLSEIVDVLEREPKLEELALHIVAADLVRSQEWDRGDATVLQQLVAQYDSPDGMAAFERGLIPSRYGPSLPITCMYPPEAGDPSDMGDSRSF